MNYTKHETAVIDAGAEIVEGPRVWNWMHVCGREKKGKRGVFRLKCLCWQ